MIHYFFYSSHRSAIRTTNCNKYVKKRREDYNHLDTVVNDEFMKLSNLNYCLPMYMHMQLVCRGDITQALLDGKCQQNKYPGPPPWACKQARVH